jgi:UDP-N-acetyl-D-glucosamine dehydrogenase
MLLERGAEVTYNDPHVPALPPPHGASHGAPRLTSSPSTEECLAEQDCVLVITAHSAYDFAWIADRCRLIVDTRNATGGLRAPRAEIVKA